MKISIIIPTYNRPRLLKNALSSVSSQTYEDYEVILVNDGGCSIEEVISQSNIKDKIKYINNDINKGLSRTLNIGIETQMAS